MKIVIIGGTGRIGSKIVANLRRALETVDRGGRPNLPAVGCSRNSGEAR